MPRAGHALAAYVVITLVVTWPLAQGLGRDVPWDLGDSVLNMWILAWDVEQLRAILSGDVSRVATFFDANIFHPAPLTLAYSEHLFAQAVQIFPIYLVTGNPILSYNLLFLSTFVLSGLGTFLLVRELTGNPAAAFVAGLIFAFVPYRLPQSSHLQVLSSQWMPFALYGLTRFASTRRIRPLAGAGAALVAQNLSSGYYLLFFTPFAAAYAVWELWRRDRWRDARAWLALSIAGVLVLAVTFPFLLPYAELRALTGAARSLPEITSFSADVYSYGTAFSEQRIWGERLRAFPKPEGELFPGFVPLLLALAGALCAGAAWRGASDVPASRAPGWLTWLLGATAIGHAAGAAVMVALRRVTLDMGLFVLRIGNINRLLLRAAVALALLLAVSPAARARLGSFFRGRGFFVVALLGALWLSLGPNPQSLGRALEIAAPYGWLVEHVPGFDGVRVPARFAMVAALMLAVLAGYGAQLVVQLPWGRHVLVVLGALFLVEATHVPFPLNATSPVRGFNAPEPRVYRPARAPAIYHEVATLPADAVIAELPIGEPDFDLRAMYYSIVHWRPVLNGYSGFYPPHYGRLSFALSEIPRHPELSLDALGAGGATHVIVHEGAFPGSEGPDTSDVLRRAGAAELHRSGPDVLFELPR